MVHNGGCSNEQVRRKRSVSETSSRPKYTEKQRRAVDRVLNLQNYYHILNVKEDATIDEINSAYKKLALHLHPDKNKAPGAKKAFQALGTVKDVLTDPVKRNMYDRQQQQKLQQLNFTSGPTFGMPEFLMSVGLVFIGIGAGWAAWKAFQKKESTHDGERSKNQVTYARQAS